MGLDVSRLARNSADRHRLIELCALIATLILDEDGIYDPASFNDRLLLGLKGTMSEAELHILRARTRGGQLNKARRGELEIGPPVGLIYRSDGRLDLDPDAEVQAAIPWLQLSLRMGGGRRGSRRLSLRQGGATVEDENAGDDASELGAIPHFLHGRHQPIPDGLDIAFRLCTPEAVQGLGVIDAHVRRRVRAIIVREEASALSLPTP